MDEKHDKYHETAVARLGVVAFIEKWCRDWNAKLTKYSEYQHRISLNGTRVDIYHSTKKPFVKWHNISDDTRGQSPGYLLPRLLEQIFFNIDPEES